MTILSLQIVVFWIFFIQGNSESNLSTFNLPLGRSQPALQNCLQQKALEIFAVWRRTTHNACSSFKMWDLVHKCGELTTIVCGLGTIVGELGCQESEAITLYVLT